jgi:hypothetical protein
MVADASVAGAGALGVINRLRGLTGWVSIGPSDVRMGEAVRCFATLQLTSVPLSVAMFVLLRYAALLRPTTVSVMGGCCRSDDVLHIIPRPWP